MIQAKLKIEYEIQTFGISKYDFTMDQFEEYCYNENCQIRDKYDLEYIIDDYLSQIEYDHSLPTGVHHSEIVDFNIDELVDYFSYLISNKKEIKETCCSKYDSCYCPDCGTKLND
jgi:hypothetical protein